MVFNRASLVAQTVKDPPAMQETWVQSLGWTDALIIVTIVYTVLECLQLAEFISTTYQRKELSWRIWGLERWSNPRLCPECEGAESLVCPEHSSLPGSTHPHLRQVPNSFSADTLQTPTLPNHGLLYFKRTGIFLYLSLLIFIEAFQLAVLEIGMHKLFHTKLLMLTWWINCLIHPFPGIYYPQVSECITYIYIRYTWDKYDI